MQRLELRRVRVFGHEWTEIKPEVSLLAGPAIDVNDRLGQQDLSDEDALGPFTRLDGSKAPIVCRVGAVGLQGQELEQNMIAVAAGYPAHTERIRVRDDARGIRPLLSGKNWAQTGCVNGLTAASVRSGPRSESDSAPDHVAANCWGKLASGQWKA